jgi:hypothetical protein
VLCVCVARRRAALRERRPSTASAGRSWPPVALAQRPSMPCRRRGRPAVPRAIWLRRSGWRCWPGRGRPGSGVGEDEAVECAPLKQRVGAYGDIGETATRRPARRPSGNASGNADRNATGMRGRRRAHADPGWPFPLAFPDGFPLTWRAGCCGRERTSEAVLGQPVSWNGGSTPPPAAVQTHRTECQSGGGPGGRSNTRRSDTASASPRSDSASLPV